MASTSSKSESSIGSKVKVSRKSRRAKIKTKISNTKVIKKRCKECGRECKSNAGLISHSSIHATTNKKFICHICHRELKSYSGLLLHLHHAHKHRGKNSLKHVCSYCEKKFPKKSMLDSHLEKHLKVLPFFCNQCDQKFSTKVKLNLHMSQVHHEEAFICIACKEVFEEKAMLNEHIQTHEEQMEECNYCEKKFNSEMDLREHIATHESKENQKAETRNDIVLRSRNSSKKKKLINQENNDKNESHEEEIRKILCQECKYECKIFYLSEKYFLFWMDKSNFECKVCNEDDGRKNMIEEMEKVKVQPVSKNNVPSSLVKHHIQNLENFMINDKDINEIAVNRMSFYMIVNEKTQVNSTSRSVVAKNKRACRKKSKIVHQSDVTSEKAAITESSNETIDAQQSIKSSTASVKQTSQNQVNEILNSLRIDLPTDLHADLQTLTDVIKWLKITIQCKEAAVKKEFIKFAQIINKRFPVSDTLLTTVRSYFCKLDTPRQLTLYNLAKNCWKFKCKRVFTDLNQQPTTSSQRSSDFSLKLFSMENDVETIPAIDLYPDYIKKIIMIFNQFLQMVAMQSCITSDIENNEAKNTNFIEIYMRANKNKDVMVVVVVRSTKLLIMEILKMWKQSLTPTSWNVKSLYYKTICPKTNYSKTILFEGMNCIAINVGEIFLTLTPKVLLQNNIDGSHLLGETLLDYFTPLKTSTLFHIGCDFGLTTLILAKKFLHVIGLDQSYFIKQARKLKILNNFSKVEFIADEIYNVEKIVEHLKRAKNTISVVLNIDSKPGKSKFILTNLKHLPNMNYIAIVTNYIEHSLPIILKLLTDNNQTINNSFIPFKSCVIDPKPSDDNLTLIILLKRRNVQIDSSSNTEIINTHDSSSRIDFSDSDSDSISSESSVDEIFND